MPRAHRCYIPDQIWHITHRCHKQEFLLKFAIDRRRWVRWLFEAKKRYGLCVLNFTATSNHIHLLVLDRGGEAIPKGIQLAAGRTAQEYNRRKGRKGAFWEDRYHATAVDTNEHLRRCLTYIDLNMIRAGVVKHPMEWRESGCRAIQNPPQRYSVIDLQALQNLLGFGSLERLQCEYRQWIDDALADDTRQREVCWTESMAVGRLSFVEAVQERMGIKARYRDVVGTEGKTYVLRELSLAYNVDSGAEIGKLSLNNTRVGSAKCLKTTE